MSLNDLTLHAFADELASVSPAPGGGSVAALAGSLGVALTTMVCQLTIGKKKYADVEQEMVSVAEDSKHLRQILSELIDRDTAAFNKVMAAFGLPKTTDEEKAKRADEIETATREATLIPLDVMKTCLGAIRLASVAARKGNANARSDSGVAALMIAAAAEGAYYNVLINLGSLRDQDFVRVTRQQADHYLSEVRNEAQQIRQTVLSAIAG